MAIGYTKIAKIRDLQYDLIQLLKTKNHCGCYKKNFVNNLADYISEIDTNMASKRLITRIITRSMSMLSL